MSDPLTSLLSMSPSIDLDKVKDILDDMGQEIPDGAKDLFKSVEMHQKVMSHLLNIMLPINNSN